MIRICFFRVEYKIRKRAGQGEKIGQKGEGRGGLLKKREFSRDSFNFPP
jgi:hypothetical protein